MNIENIIATRRSIFPPSYNDTPISEEELNRILASANWAPTHKRTEPWRFKVFHSQEAREKFASYIEAVYPKSVVQFSEVKMRIMIEKALKSACVVAVCFQREEAQSLPEWEEIAATAMAVQNMWLTAHSMGIGGYWSTPGLYKYFGEHFELSSGEQCLGFFYMGKYDGELPEGTRKSEIQDKVTWY